ncbi:MAG: hypothetical protein HYV09_03520 [Deltaproteobacteria bacterium]|nr:hypothetical protein [Deltaproteobacteria bacterium]
MTAGPDHDAVDRYVRLLRALRDARRNDVNPLRRRAEAEFFVMDGPTAAAAVRATRAEGLDF